jgi:hypothetical protein
MNELEEDSNHDDLSTKILLFLAIWLFLMFLCLYFGSNLETVSNNYVIHITDIIIFLRITIVAID